MLTTLLRLNSSRRKFEVLKSTLLPCYKSGDYPIHLDRTLDEAYYPGLTKEALVKRNNDQVVSHSNEDFEGYSMKTDSHRNLDAPILMVSQLWLWRIGEFFISAHNMTDEHRIVDELKESFGTETDLDLLAGLLIARCIEVFGKNYIYEKVAHLPALDLFENRVVAILSEVGDYVGNDKSSNVEFVKERYFTHIISDVRSELAMIQHFLEQQVEILRALLDEREKSKNAIDTAHQPAQSPLPTDDPREESSASEWAKVEGAERTLQKYKQRVRKIDGDAERIERAIQDMLNLKRTHSSINDAHSSLILSTAVIGFTVVTIVFAPLAFLTALFALKVKGFGRLQVDGQDDVFDGGKLGGIFCEYYLSFRAHMQLINRSRCRDPDPHPHIPRYQACFLVHQSLGPKKVEKGELPKALGRHA